MVEREICKGCQWNEYPLCKGTIMFNGDFMNIEDLNERFNCGQKERIELSDLSIKFKSILELKIESLESRISEMEKR